MTDRNTLFISHVTPEDNEFAVWLASRLKALGYSTWVDQKALIGGEKVWQEIDQIIRHKAIKVLLVYTNNICINGEAGILRDGISKELSLAESIAKQAKLDDFIILLNVSGSAYNLFIGADSLNHISFKDNWASGFNLLIEKLVRDNVARAEINEAIYFTEWYENLYTTTVGVIRQKSELYYSNLWAIPSLPKTLFLYRFDTEVDARAIYDNPIDYPISKRSNVLASFFDNVPLLITRDNQSLLVKLKDSFAVDTSKIIQKEFESGNSFPSQKDCEDHLKSLLNRIFHLTMKKRKILWYKLADKSLAYYHTPASLVKGYAIFEYPFRRNRKSKRKSVYGKYLDLGYWHYAISCKPHLEPVLAFSLKSHIIFTKDGFGPWSDKDKMHSHRRKKGKHLFNAEWRDMELCFLHSLCDEENKISIRLNEAFVLNMPLLPIVYWADFGYYEPRDKGRFDIIEGNVEDAYDE